MGWLTLLFDTAAFPPRWHCGDWSDVHGWSHIASDLVIFAAYVAIPVTIAIFLARRHVPFPRIGWLFVGFIFWCGMVHLLEAVIFWYPVYRFSAVVKAITAAVSVATVIALIQVLPRLLTLPSVATLDARLVAESESRRAMEETFRKFVEYAPNAVLAVDDDGIIRLANRQAVEVFGYDREELLGKNVDMLVPDQLREAHPALRHGYLSAPEPRRMAEGELMARARSGASIPVEIGLTPIETDEGRRVLCTIANVTERVEARQRLERNAAALERSNADLERFAYVASHDLQEPLRMVASYLQLIESRYAGVLDDDGREFIGFAVDGAKRMQQLINDLLAFSRVGSDDVPQATIEMDDVLRSTLRVMSTTIEEAGAIVTHESLPPVVGLESQIRALLQNLIANAIKYRSGDRPEIRVTCESRGDEHHFTVRDNGVGIESRYLERIFDVFARLHGRDVPGTGIGLAICKRIVEHHGGRIWAESQPGRGTTVHFTLRSPQGS